VRLPTATTRPSGSTASRGLSAADRALRRRLGTCAQSSPDRTENGLLLRSDLHRLFDAGYVTATPEPRIEVSRRIKEEFENGRDYYRFHGAELTVLPSSRAEQPDAGYLRWHNEHLYRG